MRTSLVIDLERKIIVRVAVVDGQGGGIGKLIIEALRKNTNSVDLHITALGTNALATSAMLKAGADDGATGENAVCVNVADVDVIVGAVGIILANGMMGELTPRMAEAIGSSCAHKVLLPVNRCRLHVVGGLSESLPRLVDMLVEEIKSIMKREETD